MKNSYFDIFSICAMSRIYLDILSMLLSTVIPLMRKHYKLSEQPNRNTKEARERYLCETERHWTKRNAHGINYARLNRNFEKKRSWHCFQRNLDSHKFKTQIINTKFQLIFQISRAF